MGKQEEIVAALRSVSERALAEGITPEQLMGFLQSETARTEFLLHNLVTFNARLEQWLEHFRDNLEMHVRDKPRVVSLKQTVEKEFGIFRRAIVIGGGPSVRPSDLRLLRGFDGLILCCNKPFKRTVGNVVPHVVMAIHGTDEIVPDFALPSTQEALREEKILLALSTHLDPKVTDMVCACTPSERIYWFNASIPPMYAQNVDSMQKLFSHDLDTLDTNGTVAGFGLVVAREVLGIKEVAMLGMEHCIDLDRNWTRDEARDNTLMWDPDNREVVAIPGVFKGYINSIVTWIGEFSATTRVVNLTPKGTFYINRDLLNVPYVPLKEYVREKL